MNKTKHFIKRQQQRAISNNVLDIIEKEGNCMRAPGGAIKIHLGNREYQNLVAKIKKILQILDKAKGGTIIIHDCDILTAYKEYE